MKNVSVLIVFCLIIFGNSYGQRPKANIETKSGVKSLYLDEIYDATFEDSSGVFRMKFKKTNTTVDSFSIAEIERITFSPFGMTDFPLIIKYIGGTSDSISLNDIEYLKFDTKSSVNEHIIAPKLACYPNPVVSARATFLFPEGCWTEIDIYSSEGIKICELKAENPGTSQSVVWNCKDKSGIDVAPGIYLSRAICSNKVYYLKFIITR